MSDGCLAFLCPGSGACVAAPHECPEGNPFSNATSLYWGQALATQHGCAHPRSPLPRSALSFMGETGENPTLFLPSRRPQRL